MYVHENRGAILKNWKSYTLQMHPCVQVLRREKAGIIVASLHSFPNKDVIEHAKFMRKRLCYLKHILLDLMNNERSEFPCDLRIVDKIEMLKDA